MDDCFFFKMSEMNGCDEKYDFFADVSKLKMSPPTRLN